MIHAFLRFSLKLVFWIYYRRIDIKGLDNVPKKGPIILACNHPNSFLDALIVGAYIKRPVYFLARSDVFNSPFKRWILEQASVLPVYRLQEGVENLDKNKTTFSRCFEILDKDAMVLIFSEGLCIQELRLRKLKKGTARIALEYAQHGKRLHVIPVGLNYLQPRTAREEVMLGIGEPIEASDFAEAYAENPGKAINDFNKVLESRLRLSVIDIADKDSEKELTEVLKIERNEGYDLYSLVKSGNNFSTLATERPHDYAKLVDTARTYGSKLKTVNLDDRAIKDQQGPRVLVSLLFPIYWLGLLLNGLPFITARWLARTKVRKVEFYDSVFLGAFMFVNQFHNLFIFLILLFFHPFLAVIIPGILLMTGGLTTVLSDVIARNTLSKRKSRLNSPDREELEKLRREILAHLPS